MAGDNCMKGHCLDEFLFSGVEESCVHNLRVPFESFAYVAQDCLPLLQKVF